MKNYSKHNEKMLSHVSSSQNFRLLIVTFPLVAEILLT